MGGRSMSGSELFHYWFVEIAEINADSATRVIMGTHDPMNYWDVERRILNVLDSDKKLLYLRGLGIKEANEHQLPAIMTDWITYAEWGRQGFNILANVSPN